MNAAGRLVHQGTLSRHLVFVQLLSRQQLFMLTLALVVFLSAFSVIYVTHLTREMHATYAQNMTEQDRMHVQRGQLLLERSTWMMQARVQKMAETQLDMIIPNHKSVVIVHE